MLELYKWYQFLNEKICQEDQNGLRPCINGINKDCFNCWSAEVETQYKQWLTENN